jgi:hypothetical protein
MSKLRYPFSGPKTTGIILSLFFVLSSHLVTQAQCPVVDAGADGNVCTTGSYQLNPILSGDYGLVEWTTTNGQGSFLPNANDPDAVYFPGGSDLDGIVLTLTLRAFPNDPIACPDVYSDQLQLTVVAAPTDYAGPDEEVCGTTPITFSGATADNYDLVQWGKLDPSSGNLTNINTLEPTFTPNAYDVANGFAEFRLFAYGNSPCGNTTGSVKRIDITPAPSVNAGSISSTCGTNPAQISGASVSNASSFIWSTSGNGTFIPNTTTQNPSYTPSI